MLALIAIAPMVAPEPGFGGEPKLCRTVHGRLTAGNGTPSVRIWVVGTRRKLGVVGANSDEDWPDLPANLERLWNAGPKSPLYRVIYGDFRVCAWHPQEPDAMQMVRVVGASRLVAVDD